jgi:hypothetical protein
MVVSSPAMFSILFAYSPVIVKLFHLWSEIVKLFHLWSEWEYTVEGRGYDSQCFDCYSTSH